MEIVGLVNQEEKADIIWIAKLAVVGQRAQFLGKEARENVLFA